MCQQDIKLLHLQLVLQTLPQYSHEIDIFSNSLRAQHADRQIVRHDLPIHTVCFKNAYKC